ncbi:ATPase-coupled protein transmembrane transporter [Aureococcus anophagefferens]|nr:ATPase-coupled protein transmembrane transporter [Aureococcus anophagefferens]
MTGTAKSEAKELGDTHGLTCSSLANEGVPHRVLNANPKLARKESEIVSQAGRRGAVTIATNMAGRGTDILLGATRADGEAEAREALAPAVDGRLGPLVAVEPGLYPVADLGDAVRALGGLAVLGTERHESVRIDNQLRGRSGRQGDAGASLRDLAEDKMFNAFGADKMQQLAFAFDIAGDDGEPLQSDLLSKSLATIQEKVETYYREMRTNLVRYDKIADAQRRLLQPPPAGRSRRRAGEDDLPAMLMRFYVMREFDAAWQQHLRDLEFLRENVGFQSYSQKDPSRSGRSSPTSSSRLSAKVYRNAAIAFLSSTSTASCPGPTSRPRRPSCPRRTTRAAAPRTRSAPLNPADDKPNRAAPRGQEEGRQVAPALGGGVRRVPSRQ